MTKSVQIQLVAGECAIEALEHVCGGNHGGFGDRRYSALAKLIEKAIASHEQAALLQVRSLLEAKAKEWEALPYGLGGGYRAACAHELLALAATLGDQ